MYKAQGGLAEQKAEEGSEAGCGSLEPGGRAQGRGSLQGGGALGGEDVVSEPPGDLSQAAHPHPRSVLSPFPTVHKLIRLSLGSEFGNGRMASSIVVQAQLTRGTHCRDGLMSSGSGLYPPGNGGRGL